MKFIKPSTGNKIIDENGRIYQSIRELAKAIDKDRKSIAKAMQKNGRYLLNGHVYTVISPQITDGELIKNNVTENIEQTTNTDPEYAEYLEKKKIEALPFDVFDISFSEEKEYGTRYAIALFSDAHIGQIIKPEYTQGINEYNLDIAKERVENYFKNLVCCINEDKVDDLIFASLGDTISGEIHDELLAESNGVTAFQMIQMAQSWIFSGLKFICDNTKLKSFKFIGIVGNHGRTKGTKKMEYSIGARDSYEYSLYWNIKNFCEITNLPIDFYIPDSHTAIVNTPDGKRYLFQHGWEVRSGGSSTITGVYPALMRTSLKMHQMYGQDKYYIGHYHRVTSIPEAAINGCICGSDSLSATLGLGSPKEKPAQLFEVYDTKRGLLVSRQIYCD